LVHLFLRLTLIWQRIEICLERGALFLDSVLARKLARVTVEAERVEDGCIFVHVLSKLVKEELK